MRTRGWILALLIGLVLSSPPARPAVTAKGNNDRINRLITELGSNRFSSRDRASKDLEAIGAPALAALRKAVNCEDMETRCRATRLVDRIERRLEAAALLAPTRVRLVCHDMPVTDAIAELAKKSRYDLQIDPSSRDKLAKRKVTLDTGEVTFWEAFDQLCLKAHLVEAVPQLIGGYQTQFGDPIQRMVPANIVPRIKIPNVPRPVRIRQFQALPIKVNPAVIGNVQVNPAVIRNLQVQIRAVAAQQIQLQLPANGPPPLPVMPANQRNWAYMIDGGGQNDGRIFLADGKPESLPNCYAGAFRIRFKINAGQASRTRGPLSVHLEVSAEPRLQNWSIAGQPRIDDAADDWGQNLTLIASATPPVDDFAGRLAWRGYIAASNWSGYRQSVVVQLKSGDKPARLLKQLKGQLVTNIVTPPQPLIAVDNILKAAGKTVKGTHGGSLKVLDVKKDGNGSYQVRYELEPPGGVTDGQNQWGAFGGMRGGMAFRRIIRMNGNMIGGNLDFPSASSLALQDGKGNAYTVVGMSSRNVNGAIEHSLTFQPVKGQGAPARLVYIGQRKVTVEVPFSLQDVKLP